MNSCQQSPRVGIARLASESGTVTEKKQVVYFELETKFDLKSLLEYGDAVLLDDQSLSWLRTRLQILLRSLYARVHGNGRRRGV